MIPGAQSTTYAANGTWKCPPSVTTVIVESAGTGSTFDALGDTKATLARFFIVTAGASYAVVRGTANVTLTWIGHARINASA